MAGRWRDTGGKGRGRGTLDRSEWLKEFWSTEKEVYDGQRRLRGRWKGWVGGCLAFATAAMLLLLLLTMLLPFWGNEKRWIALVLLVYHKGRVCTASKFKGRSIKLAWGCAVHSNGGGLGKRGVGTGSHKAGSVGGEPSGFWCGLLCRRVWMGVLMPYVGNSVGLWFVDPEWMKHSSCVAPLPGNGTTAFDFHPSMLLVEENKKGKKNVWKKKHIKNTKSMVQASQVLFFYIFLGRGWDEWGFISQPSTKNSGSVRKKKRKEGKWGTKSAKVLLFFFATWWSGGKGNLFSIEEGLSPLPQFQCCEIEVERKQRWSFL